jgi:hypothetical protein
MSDKLLVKIVNRILHTIIGYVQIPNNIKDLIIPSDAPIDKTPIIIVNGMTTDYSGNLLKLTDIPFIKESGVEIYFINTTTTNSYHDNACEMYYQIKGGRTDYGEEHSKKCYHQRYGRTWKGIVPNWSKENPIKIISYSTGGCIVMELIYLLQNNAFPQSYQKGMIKSHISAGPPLNGTTIVSLLSMTNQDISYSLFSLFNLFFILIVPLYVLQRYNIIPSYWYIDFEKWNVTDSTKLIHFMYDYIFNPHLTIRGNCSQIYDSNIRTIIKNNSKYQNMHIPPTFIIKMEAGKEIGSFYIPWMIDNYIFLPFVIIIGIVTRLIPNNTFYHGFEGKQWYKNDGIVNTISESNMLIEGNKKVFSERFIHIDDLKKLTYQDHNELFQNNLIVTTILTMSHWSILNFDNDDIRFLYKLVNGASNML